MERFFALEEKDFPIGRVSASHVVWKRHGTRHRAEQTLEEFEGEGRNSRDNLVRVLTEVLRGMEFETELFGKLLRSFRTRLDLVKEADGKQICGY